MIKITNKITLKNGETFLAENLEVLEPSFELHFDHINGHTGEWENHRSFPIEEISTIEPKILNKKY